jgi:hypothetical protein
LSSIEEERRMHSGFASVAEAEEEAGKSKRGSSSDSVWIGLYQSSPEERFHWV